MTVQKISTFLWFDKQAKDAADLYASVLPDTQINKVSYAPAGVPDLDEGDVQIVELTIMGQNYTFMNGGPTFKLDSAVSLYVLCDDQADVDKYWDALTADGGMPVQCGWLTDRYGLSWQIIPKRLEELMDSDDKDAVNRVTAAMMKMIKLDVAELERAAVTN